MSPSNRLAGKAALITGAASGIGLAVARRFAAEGASVVLADVNHDEVARVADEIGRNAIPQRVDISVEADVEAMFHAAAAAGLALDVVVANAGVQLVGQDAAVGALSLETWEQTMRVNLTGTFLTLKYAVKALEDHGGSIIVTGSATALTGAGRGFSAYAASKGGIHSLVRTAAADYACHGIRVNTVVPGYTATPLVQSISDRIEEHNDLLASIPLGRQGTPTDIEGIMVFLASDESVYATGSEFAIDGGMSAL